MNKKIVLLAMFALLLLGAVFADSLEQQRRTAIRQKIRPELLQAMDVGGGKVTVLLNLESEADLEDVSTKVKALHGRVKGKFKVGKTLLAEVPLNSLEQIAESQAVKEVWPDFEVNALEEPLQQLNAASAWNLGLYGQGKRIAVLDTGIDETHSALQGKVVAAENFSDSGTATDILGHGTHIAGIIAGSGEVQGVAPQAKLLNGKVLNDSGSGTASSVIAGINWAIDQGADVINLSLGAPIAEANTPLNQAVRDAVSQGVVVVVSAGNCGQSCPSSSCNGFVGVTMPGNTSEALTVGAVDSARNLACFSSGGVFGLEIKPDLVAPGVGIVSSVPNGTEAKTGTSMSAPFAAGAAALVLEQHPDFSATEVKQFLEQTALDLGLQGEDAQYGFGLIDLSKIGLDFDFFPDQNNWLPPTNDNGSDVNFAESEFTFSGPETVYKLTQGSYSVWHQGIDGQEIAAQGTETVDVIVEFVVLNEFGEVVERHFVGPNEYHPDSSVSFDYDWMPERTGNFTVKATIHREGIVSNEVGASDISAATAEKSVKATVPADMLQINSFTIPSQMERGTSIVLLLNVTNNGYMDVNAIGEVQFLDETGNIFEVLAGEEKPICNVSCHKDTDCDDQNLDTIDICNNDGACNSSCVNLIVPPPCEVACYNDSGCDDGNPDTIDVCNNDGECDSSCHNILLSQLDVGQTGEFSFNTLMDLPNGDYVVKAIAYFEDRSVSVEGQMTVLFPENCLVQNLVVPASVETGSELNGTIEFTNNTDLEAQPMFSAQVLNGSEQVGNFFFEGNDVAGHSTEQYDFVWNADVAPGHYALQFEVKYNGNVTGVVQGFDVVDTVSPLVESVVFDSSLSQNSFNQIQVNASDLTGVASVTASVFSPSGQNHSVQLLQTGFGYNGEWSLGFTETEEIGTYGLQAEACDAYNNCSLSGSQQFTVTAMPGECSERNVLLVESDTGFSIGQEKQSKWLQELDAQLNCTQLWKKSVHGTLSLDYLQKFHTIVWAAGNRFGKSIDTDDSQLLTDYINVGGNLLLEGSDIASDYLGDLNFENQVMHSVLENDFALANNTSLVLGSHKVLEGIDSIDLNAELCPYPDSLAVIDGEAIASWNSGGAAAIAFEGGNAKILYYAFALDAIEDKNKQKTLVENSIEWFKPNKPPVLDPIASQTAMEGQSFTLTVTATDPDNDTLIFYDDTAMFDIGPGTGLISFTPASTDIGVHNVNILVSDGSLIDSQIVRFTIEKACDSSSHLSCASAYVISDGETKSDMCGDMQYFKIVTTETCDIAWSLSDDSGSDYDIYTTYSNNTCPSKSTWDCRPYLGSSYESCSQVALLPGTYYATVDRYSGSGRYSMSVNLSNCTSNSPPSVLSVVDSPDPVMANDAVEFTVDWLDAGDQTKTKICKTNSLSGTSCIGGAWCETSSWSSATAKCSYTTTESDVGTNDYYSFVCDDGGLCSEKVSSGGVSSTGEIGVKSDYLDGFIHYRNGAYYGTSSYSIRAGLYSYSTTSYIRRGVLEFDIGGIGKVASAEFSLGYSSRNIRNETCSFDLYSIETLGSSIDKYDWDSPEFEKVKDNWFDETISGDISVDMTEAWNNAVDAGRDYLALRIAMDNEENYTTFGNNCIVYFDDTGYTPSPSIAYTTAVDGPSGTFTVTVSEQNLAPTIDSFLPVSNPTINEGEQQGFSITKSDSDNDFLTVEWRVNGSVALNDSDSYTHSTDYYSAGTYTIKAIVSDGELSDSHEWTLTVQDVPIACYNSSECDDLNNYTEDTCINAGTPQAYCSYEAIACIANTDCDDADSWTEDICINPGTTVSYCENKAITCFADSDCPATTYSTNYCSGTTGNVVRSVNSYTCTNPGTFGSSCLLQLSTETVETCSNGCLAGQCNLAGDCHTRPLWDWSYCTTACPCDVGEGDCDSDSQCKTGLVCAMDVGPVYGQTSTMDVCEEEQQISSNIIAVKSDYLDGYLQQRNSSIYGYSSSVRAGHYSTSSYNYIRRGVLEFYIGDVGMVQQAEFSLDYSSRSISGEICTFDLFSTETLGSSIGASDWDKTIFEKVKDNWFNQSISGDISVDVTQAWNNAINAGRNYLSLRILMDNEENYTLLAKRCMVYFYDTGTSGTDPHISYTK